MHLSKTWQVFLGVALLVLSGPVSAKMYKWVDEHGNVHYSDKPHKDAKELDLPPLPTYSIDTPAKPVASPAEEEPAPSEVKAEPKKDRQYQTMTIEVPAQDATIRSNSGDVSVRVKMYPRIDNEARHRFRVLIDGQANKTLFDSARMVVGGVERGTHTVQVEVLNKDGKVLKTSNSVTFHLRKASVK